MQVCTNRAQVQHVYNTSIHMYSDVEDHLVGLKEPLGRVVFEWHESDIVDYIKVFTHKKKIKKSLNC